MSGSVRPHPERWDRPHTPAAPGLPVEITTVADIRQRASHDLLQRPGRVPFHVVLVCTSGDGLHEVDFTPVNLRPGRVVHVRPGQVHRWRSPGSYEATLVFFSETVGEFPGSGWPVGPRWFDIDDREWNHAKATIELIRRELGINRDISRQSRALKGALEVLIINLGLDLGRQEATGSLPEPYVELMNQIESDTGWSRSVEDRARRLGYSQRTLTRACLTATGRSAKQVIDDRVLLEAQRLLADPEQTITQAANTMRFTEPANFSRFFKRTSGESPQEWLRRHIPASTQGEPSALPIATHELRRASARPTDATAETPAQQPTETSIRTTVPPNGVRGI